MTIQASLVLRDIFQFNTIWHGRSMAESDTAACYQSRVCIEYINEIITQLI